MERITIQMEMFTLDNGLKEGSKAMEHLYGMTTVPKMETYTPENSSMKRCKGLEHTTPQMGMFTLENGLKAECWLIDRRHCSMEIFMKGNLPMTSTFDLEHRKTRMFLPTYPYRGHCKSFTGSTRRLNYRRSKLSHNSREKVLV